MSLIFRTHPFFRFDSELPYGVGGATSFARAYQALTAVAPSLSETAKIVILGQAWAESQFGDAFKTPDGSPSNNWGAVYASGDKGTFERTDTAEGKTIKVNVGWNSTPEAGARQFYNLIAHNYAPAIERASDGDLWGYSEALWRDGPCNTPWHKGCPKRPAYYGGFPPGDKNALAPKGVEAGSDEDRWYRILAYAKFVQGGANAARKSLGKSVNLHLDAPPNPGGGSGVGTLLVLGSAAGAAWWLFRRGGIVVMRRYLPFV